MGVTPSNMGRPGGELLGVCPEVPAEWRVDSVVHGGLVHPALQALPTVVLLGAGLQLTVVGVSPTGPFPGPVPVAGAPGWRPSTDFAASLKSCWRRQ